MLLLHVGLILLYVVRSDGTGCFDCQRLPVPRDCDHVSNCGEHEVCHVTQYVSRSGNIFYDLGCKDIVRCQNKRDINDNITLEDSGDVTVCDKCCDGDFCNVQGCGSAPLPPIAERGPVCFSCPLGSLRPEQCETVASCGQDEQCSIEPFVGVGGDMLYRSSCKVCGTSEVGLIGRRDETCSGCCSTDYCNQNCSMLKPEITSPAPVQTTVLPTSTSTTTQPTTTTPIVTTTSTPEQRCTGRNYTYISQFNHCIKVYSNMNLNWNKAREHCRQDSGDLLVLHNKPEETYLADMLTHTIGQSATFWVGASDIEHEGRWIWIDGIPVASSYWFPTEPNNHKHTHGTENCAEFTYFTNDQKILLNDDICSRDSNFICEINFKETCPEPSYTYLPQLDLCFKIYNETHQWDTSRDMCLADHAILLEPTTKDQVDFFDTYLRQINSGRFWIGARRDPDKLSHIEWQSSLQPVLGDLWHVNEPSSKDEQCVALQKFLNRNRFLLNDVSCSDHMRFICQYKR